jgi:trigger factor
VHFHGRFLDEPEREEINVDDVDVTLAGPGVQPEFTENLSGAKVDEQRTFTVNYAPDHSATDLAGKRVEYTATVTAVRRKELPDVDDEWAKSLGEEIESLEVLRTKMREDLDKNADAEADHRLRNEVLAKLLEAHQFEVPETLINHQANHRLESVVRDMIGRGIDPRHQQLDWEGAREELKLQATEDVRSSLLLERIAEQEKIEVTEAEIEAEIEAISKSTRQPKEQVRGVLTKEGGERSIANRLRNRKALDLLTQSAHVTEEEWTEPEKDDATTQNSEST